VFTCKIFDVPFTITGYTALRGLDGFLYYADEGDDGDLIPTEYIVGRVEPTTKGLQKGRKRSAPKDCEVDLCDDERESSERKVDKKQGGRKGKHATKEKKTPKQIAKSKESSDQNGRKGKKIKKRATRGLRALSPTIPQDVQTIDGIDDIDYERQNHRRAAISTTGTLKNLVIPIRFKDHAERTLPSQADLSVLFNNNGPDPKLCPTGSVKDVFQENSYGKLIVESTVLPWVQVELEEAVIANKKSGYVKVSAALCDDRSGKIISHRTLYSGG
jgi:hypothetical protein